MHIQLVLQSYKLCYPFDSFLDLVLWHTDLLGSKLKLLADRFQKQLIIRVLEYISYLF